MFYGIGGFDAEKAVQPGIGASAHFVNKIEAVKLMRERGVSIAQASRNLDPHPNVLRNWVKDYEAGPGSALPGHGQMKPAPLEIERLGRVMRCTGATGQLPPKC